MDSAILSEMIETRRRLHQHPEEGWTEFETTWLVYNRLKALGCESVLTGTRLINPDCVPLPGSIDRLIERKTDKVAIVEGRQWPFEHPKKYDQKTLETPWASGAFELIDSDFY